MKIRLRYGVLGAAIATAVVVFPVFAQEQPRTSNQTRAPQQIRDQEIYGHQLMTPAERNAYRNKMRATKTAEEREKVRLEHHALMQARAKERGITLPDEPPAGRGSGAGPDPGSGGGMGPGGGRRY